MYVSLQQTMTRKVHEWRDLYGEIKKYSVLQTLGAQTWIDVAIHFADITSLAIWNHNKTWVCVPPNLECMRFENLSDLLSATCYTNWEWKYTESFKKLLNNKKIVLLGIGNNIITGVSPQRDLSHFDL